MNQKFERIEKHLYRRQYQTSGGKWSTLFYAIFVDWKGVRRNFPLGDRLDRARNKLGEYQRKNDAEFDFDKDKIERAAREMTFGKWARDHKSEISECHFKPLVEFFDDRVLSTIGDKSVEDYRRKRKDDYVIRHGKPSRVKVSATTINKEVSAFRKLLRMARKKGFHDQVTQFPMEKEPSRRRTLTAEEYMKLLESAPAWLRRACIMAYETSLSRSDLLELTESEIKQADGIIERDRNKSGAEQVIPIVTPELAAVIDELMAERKRLPNAAGLLFTIDGQAISENLFEYWFRASCKKAGIKDFRFHDLRHCAISNWAAAGIPTAAAMLAAGHKSVQSHKKYQNLQRDQLKNAFQILLTSRLHGNQQQRRAAVSS